jgi:hypothetical protein
LSPEPAPADPGTPQIALQGPATAPAYLLAGADGRILASGEVFNRLIGVDAIASPAVATAIVAITNASQEMVAVSIEASQGRRLDSRVEAVLGPADQRLALIEVQIPRPPEGAAAVVEWFPTFAADSDTIVWLKDLTERYLYVNRQYTAQLGAEPGEVCGHDDTELGQMEAIDGPRVRSTVRTGLESRSSGAMPMQLEYTIPSFDRRPAYSALRFPLLSPRGEPLVVCGVASPAEHSEIALRECERLLQVLRWFRGDAREIRQETMAAWNLTAVRPEGLEFETSAEVSASVAELADTRARAEVAEHESAELAGHLAALQHQLSAEHSRALDLEASLSDARGRADALAASLEVANARAGTAESAHARIRDLESMVARASSAGVAAAETAKRVTELESEARALSVALEQERAERKAIEAIAGRGRADIEQERARHAAALETVERTFREALQESDDRSEAERQQLQQQHETELRHAHERRGAELRRAQQDHQAELREAEARHAAELQGAQAPHAAELHDVQALHAAELQDGVERAAAQIAEANGRHAAELQQADRRREEELRATEARAEADRQSVAAWHRGELRGAEERRQTELRALEEELRSQDSGDDAAHQAEIEFLKRMHQEELLARCEQVAFELTAAQDEEIAHLRQSFEEALAATEHHESALSDEQTRTRMELNAANQRHQAEINHLREQQAAQLQRRVHAAERTDEQMTELSRKLTLAQSQVGELQGALAASRDHITRLERAGAAATGAAEGPVDPTVAPPTQPSQPAAPPSKPQAEPERSPSQPAVPDAEGGERPLRQPQILTDQPLLIGDDPRPAPAEPPQVERRVPAAAEVRQPGWDPAAQQALTDALHGCLNLRSILSESVRLIGTGGAWDVVVAWLPNEREAKYSCVATWVRSPVEMARLETSMWQVRQDPASSAIGAVADSGDIAWMNDPETDDRHLAYVSSEGMNTVVLMPVRQQGRTFAVLELCSESRARQSPQAEAALHSIEVEIGAANRRLVDSATASQWGRRRR